MKRLFAVVAVLVLCISMFSVIMHISKAQNNVVTVTSEFDTYPGVLPYSDPNDNLYVGWTLDVTTPGATDGRDVVTQKIGASITGTVEIVVAGFYQVSVYVLDRGTTDKIQVDSKEWTFVAPATGTYYHEEFKRVSLGEIYLSTGPHSVTLTHIAAGTAGSYPTNSILDFLEFVNGLVGYWKFDEGSGTVAQDSSGNGNDGTVVDASWTNGVSNGALQFDGIDDYVGVPTSQSLCVTGNQMSVQLWMKPAVTLDANTPITNILDKGDEYGFQMDQYSSGRIWFFVWLNGAPWQGIQTTTSRWEADCWYLLTGTYGGSSLKVYVNGVLENSRTLSSDLSTSSCPLAIGSYCFGTKNFFNGAIDEVKIYNYARTADEIQADAGSFVRAWKDAGSFGLENSRLLIHGLPATGNYLWFFDYLIFKDTGTMWYQPWGELAMLVYPNFQWNGVSTTDFEVNAFTETDKAYLNYSITSGNLKEELTYTIYPGEPYVNVTLSIMNVGSATENTYAGVQFTTWIAGDHANDYFYVPGHGQGQFNGVGNINFPDANETWIAEWDQNKNEGCGMLSTKSFTPSNMITEDFGIGEGFKFISDNFDLAPGQMSATYDCCFYFFAGTGWQKTKDFYDIVSRGARANTLGITILTPENRTYTVSDVSLTFVSNVSVSWVAYALDDQTNVTVLGNTTLLGLNEGSHSIVVYANDTAGNMGSSQIVYFRLSVPDVGVLNMTASKTIVGRGYPVGVNITVANLGIDPVSFNFTVYANATEINYQTITLEAGESITFSVVWNTTSFEFGKYILSAYAEPTLGETHTADNTLLGSSVIVTIPGDINGNGGVDILDAILLARAFSPISKSPNWNPNADINDDNFVNILDAIILSNHYGQHYP